MLTVADVRTTRSRTLPRRPPAGSRKGVGDATDNEDLQAEGQVDQSKANVKQAGEKVKDAFQ